MPFPTRSPPPWPGLTVFAKHLARSDTDLLLSLEMEFVLSLSPLEREREREMVQGLLPPFHTGMLSGVHS